MLLVVAYMIATANGSWWRTVTAGRYLVESATWVFVSACFVIVALPFALLATFAIAGSSSHC
jgi:hypothetical protein